MGRLYKIVDAQGKDNPQVLERARQEIAALHAGDEENLAIWKQLRAASEPQLAAMYQRLDIHVDETLGESFYHERLSALVDDLMQRNVAKESQGAIVVAFDEPALQDRAMLIRKTDGSFLYATTDLATIDYRLERWQPDEIIYVVDARQSLHFRQLFAAVRLWGHENVQLQHIEFGKILGEDGTPIKTRDGEPPRLDALLDEAQRRALEIVQAKKSRFERRSPANRSRARGRNWRAQVRRFVAESQQRLHVFVGQIAGDAGQQRALFAVRLCARALDFPPRWFERQRSCAIVHCKYLQLGTRQRIGLVQVLAALPRSR